MVQWLGLRAFTARTRVPSLVRELRSCKLCGVAKKKRKKEQEGTPKHTSSYDSWEDSDLKAGNHLEQRLAHTKYSTSTHVLYSQLPPLENENETKISVSTILCGLKKTTTV